MRVVLCDDDAVLRRIVGSLVEADGGQVIAETDSGYDAVDLVRRFTPDVLVLDLALRLGSGWDVLAAVAGTSCRTIVFSAFVDDPARFRSAGVDAVVAKPDFDALQAAIKSLAAARPPAERRSHATRGVAPPSGRSASGEDPDFYAMVADALAGDTLVAFDVEPPGDGDAPAPSADELLRLVRANIRAQDRVTRRGASVLVLVVGGHPLAAGAVRARVESAWSEAGSRPPLRARVAVVEADGGTEAFARLAASGG